MKTLNNYINEALIKKDTKISIYNYYPKDKDELRSLLYKLLKERGKDADLNDIDTSAIQDFCYISYTRDLGLFYKLDIGNIDISKWNMSNATNISYMFYDCEKFNCDLSKWDLSQVEDMESMFSGCKKFNSDLSKWDVSKVEWMDSLFDNCPSLKNKPSWYKE